MCDYRIGFIDFIIEYKEIVMTIVISIISSGILNVILTHILYSSKLKKDLKVQASSKHIQRTEESLCAFRELANELSTIEIYDIEKELLTHGSSLDMFKPQGVYPEIFNTWESFNNYRNKVSSFRKVHERNLNCRQALNIVYIDRYMNQLSLFMSEHGNNLPFWGAIFIHDIQMWQQKVDLMIVNDINKHNYKLESHEGRKWNKCRKKEVEKQYAKTLLCYLLTDKCRRVDRKRYQAVKEILQKYI